VTQSALLNIGMCWGTPSGQDISTPSYMASGAQCVAEAVARRWSTSRGGLIDDPDYGYNLTDMISADLAPSDISYAQEQLAAEAEKDERVLSAAVTLSLSIAGVLMCVGVIMTSVGPFRMVVSVANATVSLLLVTS
jgi:hypothetical protein